MNENQVRDKVRQIVDPLLMRLRTDLFGTVYNTTLKDAVIPKSAITSGVTAGIAEVVADGSLVRAHTPFTVGSAGVQAGRIVYYTGSVVEHADCTNALHMGRVIGVAVTTADPGSSVNVQTYGTLELTGVYAFSTIGRVFLGTNGTLVSSILSTAQFMQCIGTALSPTRLLVAVEQTVIKL
jgi:hypothetical protein